MFQMKLSMTFVTVTVFLKRFVRLERSRNYSLYLLWCLLAPCLPFPPRWTQFCQENVPHINSLSWSTVLVNPWESKWFRNCRASDLHEAQPVLSLPLFQAMSHQEVPAINHKSARTASISSKLKWCSAVFFTVTLEITHSLSFGSRWSHHRLE